ncbi:SEC-C metal-binding domain-containing protein [Paenibacillus ferrarius]|uniref:SEC-C metal-binding domain-containing protein n=1 Tax=Paenibacillus ferrarius TaxID=1469647 RepID=UPI003D2C3B3B
MATGRNDICLCGSGKKYKKCCLQKDKESENLEKKRKYMEEFCLHSFSSEVRLTYPNKLKEIERGGTILNYHIYMIHLIPRLSFIEESFKADKNGVSLEIQVNYGTEFHVEKFTFSLGNEEHSNLRFNLDNNKKDLIIQNEVGGGLKTDVLSLYVHLGIKNKRRPSRLKCKVLYVGQAYGKDGKRTAFERLTSHEKMIEILGDTLYSGNNYDVGVSLWEFTPRLMTSFDGISNNYVISPDQDSHRVEEVLKHQSHQSVTIDKQIVNITEAALINYFKPHYNEKLKDNFPDIKHKGYKYYYNYDFNSVCVELDTDCINISLYSDLIENHCEWDFIQYILDNDKKRKDMFEIFE